MICYLGLGSNLGERRDYIDQAVSLLATHPGIDFLAGSSIIETRAFGKTDQPDFLNCAIKIETSLNPVELLNFCLETEKKLGRIRTEKWAARTIDIDILFYDDLIVEDENLIIPHPGIAQRGFVLASLLELCPEFVHPVLGKTIAMIYDEIRL